MREKPHILTVLPLDSLSTTVEHRSQPSYAFDAAESKTRHYLYLLRQELVPLLSLTLVLNTRSYRGCTHNKAAYTHTFRELVQLLPRLQRSISILEEPRIFVLFDVDGDGFERGRRGRGSGRRGRGGGRDSGTWFRSRTRARRHRGS